MSVEYAFSTWGMPALTASEWAALPKLKAVFYAAGSVKGFAEPLLARGVHVISAAAANAEPVAEFTLAQILLAGKNFLRASAALKARGPEAWQEPDCPGNYGTQVALLGAGQVGRRVAELLKPFKLEILVFDPFLSAEDATRLGVDRVTLSEAFQRGHVVSNHLADVPETRGMLNEALFRSMPRDASFINTGRGATVDEAGLWRALTARPDLNAVLDVTDPEPPLPGGAAFSLPNVFLSPHLAGSLKSEVGRMASLVVDECESLLQGRPLRHEVSLSMLKTMA